MKLTYVLHKHRARFTIKCPKIEKKILDHRANRSFIRTLDLKVLGTLNSGVPDFTGIARDQKTSSDLVKDLNWDDPGQKIEEKIKRKIRRWAE